MKKGTCAYPALTAICFLLLSGQSSASLIGDPVTYERYRQNGTVDTLVSTIVGNGIDIQDCIYTCASALPLGHFDVDVYSNGINISYSGNPTVFASSSRDFNHIRISSLDSVTDPEMAIQGITATWSGVDNNNFTPAFSLADFAYGDDFLDISIGGLIFTDGDYIDVTLDFGPVSVDEPPFLFLWGLLACYFLHRSER